MTSQQRNTKVSAQLENQRTSGIRQLIEKGESLISEAQLRELMTKANLKFYGAIDLEDQDKLFEYYGVLFQPARNKGKDKWVMVNFLN